MTALNGRVIGALRTASITGSQVALTCGDLGEDFAEVKEVIRRIRGVWRGSRTSAFVCPDEIDPKPLIADIVKNGVMPEKNRYQLYPTSPSVVEFAIAWIGDEFDYLERPLRILEPSGGLGGMAMAIKERFPDCELVVVEIDPLNCALMESRGLQPICQDFLTYQQEQKFDIILANPPFDGTACAKHFNRMFDLLDKGGMLLCVLPSRIEERTDVESVARMLDVINTLGEKEDLPAGSFKPLTDTDTFIAKVWKSMNRSRSRTETVLIQMDAEYGTYQKVNDLFEEVGDASVNLLGEVDDPEFREGIRKIVVEAMTKGKCFINLVNDEWEETYQHYYQKMTETTRWQAEYAK